MFPFLPCDARIRKRPISSAYSNVNTKNRCRHRKTEPTPAKRCVVKHSFSVSQERIILKPGVVIGSNNQPSIGIFKINTDPPFLTPTPGWGRQRGHLARGRRRQRSHLAGGDDFDC